MKVLKGQFIPKKYSKRRDVIFLGEKPSLYFIRHPEERHKGNYNATNTDFIFQKYILKYLKHAVYVTDMVKTEGKSGTDFEKEWRKNSKFAFTLKKEFERHNPKIIVAMSQKVYKLLQTDKRFLKWEGRIQKINHPAHTVRYRKYDVWDKQFRYISKKLK